MARGAIPASPRASSRSSLPFSQTEKLYGHGFELIALHSAHTIPIIATACKATSSEHAVIRLFDSNTWKTIPGQQPLEGHALTITSLKFSRDDRWLLSTSRDRTWRLFERRGGELTCLRVREVGGSATDVGSLNKQTHTYQLHQPSRTLVSSGMAAGPPTIPSSPRPRETRRFVSAIFVEASRSLTRSVPTGQGLDTALSISVSSRVVLRRDAEVRGSSHCRRRGRSTRTEVHLLLVFSTETALLILLVSSTARTFSLSASRTERSAFSPPRSPSRHLGPRS